MPGPGVVTDAYVDVHARTAKAQAQITAFAKRMEKILNGLNGELDLNSAMKGSKNLNNLAAAVKRVDDDVRIAMVRTKEFRFTLQDLGAGTRALRRDFKDIFSDIDSQVLVDIEERIKATRREFDISTTGMAKSSDEYRLALDRARDSTVEISQDVDLFRDRMKDLRLETDRNIEVEREHERIMRTRAKQTSVLGNAFKNLGSKVSGAFSGMDHTVRAVLATILAAGPEVAALGAGLSAALIGVASAASYAVAALAPLAGVLAPVAGAFAAAIVGFQDLDKYAPGVKAAMDSFTEGFQDIAVGALFDQWGDSLQRFFESLSVLNDPALFGAIGQSVASITNAFTGLISSESFTAFLDAVRGPLSEAMVSLGGAAASLLGLLLDFFTASAPYARLLAESFEQWSVSLREAFGEAVQSGAFKEFMIDAIVSLRRVMELAGSLTEMLGLLFEAGNESGRILIDRLTGLIDQFNQWMQSLEGQAALEDFFNNGLIVMEALGSLLGDVSTMLRDLVTPESVATLVSVLGSLGDIIIFLGEVLSTIGDSGILASLLDVIADLLPAFRPLLPVIEDVLGLLGSLVEFVAPILIPLIQELGTWLALLTPSLSMWAALFDGLRLALEPALGPMSEIVSRFAELAPSLSERMAPILATFIEQLAALAPKFLEVVETMIPLSERILDFIGRVFESDEFLKGLEATLTLTVAALDLFLDVMIAIAPVVVGVYDAIFDFVGILVDAGLAVNDFVGRAISRFINFGDSVKDTVEGIKDIAATIASPFIEAFNKIARAWNSTVGSLNVSIPDWVPGIGGKKWSAPDLPTFATGGISNIPSIFGDGAGREAAIPLDLPLNQVDPSVREMAALIRGERTGSTSTRSTVIEPGAIVVMAPQSNPALVASEVLDEIVDNL